MTLSKLGLLFLLTASFSLSAFADSASNDSKLALLIADATRLEKVEVSAFDSALKSEQTIDGDEGSSSIVTVNVNGQDLTYIISKDGGGQIRSITLQEK